MSRRRHQSKRVGANLIPRQDLVHSNRIILGVQTKERSLDRQDPVGRGCSTVILGDGFVAKDLPGDLVVELAHTDDFGADSVEINYVCVFEGVGVLEEDLLEVAAHGWGVDLASKPSTLNRQTRSI